MKKLGVIANCTKVRAADILGRLAGTAAELGFRIYGDEPTAALLPGCDSVGADGLFDEVDALIALGGDGTVLRVARALGGRDKPVMGINIGGLGFLTSVSEEDLTHALECLVKDDFETTERAILKSNVEREGSQIASYYALNDIVVGTDSSRVLTLGVSIDGDDVTSYMCDGLIVSTPTGSTGHSLSAGGPILLPETPAMVLSVMCPHTLSSRPLVMPDSVAIYITVDACHGTPRLSGDGQVGQLLQEKDVVMIQRSDRSVRLIHLPGHSYFSVLRQKLHWSGSSVLTS